MNKITTWRQGKFIDMPRYRGWSKEDKEIAQKREEKLVRPSPTGNAICQCQTSQEAIWIAERLNLAAKLEQMAYSFAIGRTDGSDIVALVKQSLD